VVKVGHIVRWIVGSARSEALMLPLDEAIRLGEVELLFVGAVRIVGIAGVAITDYQRLQVCRKLSTKRFLVGSQTSLMTWPRFL